MPAKIQDEEMVGRTFERLYVISRSGDGDLWNCSCSCGNFEGVKRGKGLRSGQIKSCGCYRKDVGRKSLANIDKTTHNMTKTRTYIAWRNMKARCNDKNHQAFVNYGGRGIAYAPSWEKFEGFLADMGECDTGLTLDRIDVNKDYCSDNCKWADMKDQAMHKRKTKSTCTSKYKGVCFNKKAGKYKAYFKYDGKLHHLGYSKNDRDLAERYDEFVFSLTGSWEGTNKALGLLEE